MEKAQLEAIIRPVPMAISGHDVSIDHLINHELKTLAQYGPLELCPEFQRGHVWTQQQQTYYLENLYRGLLSNQAKTILFNVPSWNVDTSSFTKVQCIDGLQRLTAFKAFLNGDIQPFGLSLQEFEASPFYSPKRMTSHMSLRVEIFDFQTQEDVIQFYLDLNSGGTPHTQEELERVRALLDTETAPQP